MSEERRESAEEVREERTPAGDTPSEGGDKNTCPECGGSGRIQNNVTCPNCGGTGVVQAVGGG